MNGYLWKKEWCWPYESAWSILEKFKYANTISNDSIQFAISLRTSTLTMIFIEKLYIYRQSKLAEDDFLRFFQISPNHFDVLDVFKGNDYNHQKNGGFEFIVKPPFGLLYIVWRTTT